MGWSDRPGNARIFFLTYQGIAFSMAFLTHPVYTIEKNIEMGKK